MIAAAEATRAQRTGMNEDRVGESTGLRSAAHS
jgi:hypothetical protein